MGSWLTWAKGAVAVGVAVAAFLAAREISHLRQAESFWEARADSALVQYEEAQASWQQDSLRVDSLQDYSASLADSLNRRAPAIRERVEQVQAETPVAIASHPAVQARDSLIQELVEESAGWRAAYETEREASEALRTALFVAQTSGRALADAITARPEEKPWYVPRVGIGPSVGIQLDGRGYAGVGLHLVWEIPFT